ncbi:MAG: substrate-binding domain-containing protein [Crocinitomicaceae bacterium]
MKSTKIISIAIASILFSACGGKSNEPTDTPTSGEVKIIVDESFQPLFKNQIYTFESIYKNAKIDVTYQSEGESINLMLNDSCKVIVICRDLISAERKKFESHNIFPISTKIAEDAIAIVVNPENTDSVFTVENIRRILLGADSTWNAVNSSSSLGKIDVVFDNQGSANARYMQDTILGGKNFGKNIFAMKSNEQVIDYVSKNKNAIGFISVNWISDMDDPQVQEFLKKIKVVAISKAPAEDAYKPYQAYIKTKDYPFTRNVYMINRQTRAGLGMGFVHFVAGDKGQLMILKAGLIPAISPVRLVQVNIE